MRYTEWARKCRIGFAAMVGLGVFASYSDAAVFTFDPDGAGPLAPIAASGLDWGVGNSLATSRVPITVGSTFQQYYQATLAGVINGGGTTIAPAGLNSTFEITAVASVTQLVTSIATAGGSTTVRSQLAPTQANNSFVEIWYGATANASNLAGTGFNDGTRILFAAPNATRPSVGNYSNAVSAGGGPILDSFDLFGADNYPNTRTLVGAGGLTFDGDVSNTDPAFFLSAVNAMSFNTSLVTPFQETDPSMLFSGMPGGAAPAVAPALGAVNGVNGPDFQFQADANNTFTGIPEPLSSSVALLSLSGLMLRRRTHRV
ncbi:hypothetical protein BH09PLA1_BH09PLA1_15100 [soil metagenome]